MSFHPLLLLLEIFTKALCSFWTWMVLTLPPHRRIKGLLNRKVLPRCGRKKAPSDSVTYSFSPLLVFVFALLVCFAFIFWVNIFLCIALFNIFLFVYLSVFALFCFSQKLKKNWKKKYKNSVCLCTLVLVYLGWPLKQNFLKFVSFVTLDELLYAQLSK